MHPLSPASPVAARVAAKVEHFSGDLELSFTRAVFGDGGESCAWASAAHVESAACCVRSLVKLEARVNGFGGLVSPMFPDFLMKLALGAAEPSAAEESEDPQTSSATAWGDVGKPVTPYNPFGPLVVSESLEESLARLTILHVLEGRASAIGRMSGPLKESLCASVSTLELWTRVAELGGGTRREQTRAAGALLIQTPHADQPKVARAVAACAVHLRLESAAIRAVDALLRSPPVDRDEVAASDTKAVATVACAFPAAFAAAFRLRLSPGQRFGVAAFAASPEVSALLSIDKEPLSLWVTRRGASLRNNEVTALALSAVKRNGYEGLKELVEVLGPEVSHEHRLGVFGLVCEDPIDVGRGLVLTSKMGTELFEGGYSWSLRSATSVCSRLSPYISEAGLANLEELCGCTCVAGSEGTISNLFGRGMLGSAQRLLEAANTESPLLETEAVRILCAACRGGSVRALNMAVRRIPALRCEKSEIPQGVSITEFAGFHLGAHSAWRAALFTCVDWSRPATTSAVCSFIESAFERKCPGRYMLASCAERLLVRYALANNACGFLREAARRRCPAIHRRVGVLFRRIFERLGESPPHFVMQACKAGGSHSAATRGQDACGGGTSAWADFETMQYIVSS